MNYAYMQNESRTYSPRFLLSVFSLPLELAVKLLPPTSRLFFRVFAAVLSKMPTCHCFFKLLRETVEYLRNERYPTPCFLEKGAKLASPSIFVKFIFQVGGFEAACARI